MTEQEKKDFAELVATSTATAVAKALKPDAGDSKDTDKESAVRKEDPKVDLTDPKAVKEHIKQLKLKKAIEGLDQNDPEALEKHLKSLEEAADVETESDADSDETPGSLQKSKGDSEFTSYATQDKVMKEFEDLAEAALGLKKK
jgi:hypothetical protein